VTRPSAIQQYLEGFPDKEQKTGPRPRIRTKSETPKPKRYLLPIEVAIDAAQRRAASGEWDGAKGATLVGLYAICHRMIYGIIPQELCEKALFNIAAKLAAVALHKHFDDDPSAAAAFVKWSWEREKRLSGMGLGSRRS